MSTDKNPTLANAPRLEHYEEEVKLLRARLAHFEDELKMREFSIFRSLKTLFEDGYAYYRGERDFPKEAFLGAVFAYLRPRMVIIVGSILAASMAAIQVLILVQQNVYIQEQARANRLEAIQAVLSNIQDGDASSLAIAAAQFESFQPEGGDILLRLAESRPVELAYPAQISIAVSARNALVTVAEALTDQQKARLLVILMHSFAEAGIVAWEIAADEKADPDSEILATLRPEQDPRLTKAHERILLDQFIRNLEDPASLAPHLPPTFAQPVAAVYAVILDSVEHSLAEEPAELSPQRAPRPSDWRVRGGKNNDLLDDALTSLCARVVGEGAQVPSLLRYLHEEGKSRYPSPRMGDRQALYSRLLEGKCRPALDQGLHRPES